VPHKKYARGTEVFIGGLPPQATEEDIRGVFGRVGEIQEIRIKKGQLERDKHQEGSVSERFASRRVGYSGATSAGDRGGAGRGLTHVCRRESGVGICLTVPPPSCAAD
jgi:hypothetical protein